jgi:hypothetical protein
VAREALALRLDGVDQRGLLGRSGGGSGIERAGVAEAATGYLGDLCIVAGVERREPVAPAQRLGVVRVAALPVLRIAQIAWSSRCSPSRWRSHRSAGSRFQMRTGEVALEGGAERPPSSGGAWAPAIPPAGAAPGR